MQRIAPDRKAILSWVVVLVVKRLKAGDHGIASDPNRKTNNPEKKQDSGGNTRSEEHTSELQSRRDLVCRLLLEKKKKRSPPPSSPRSGMTPAGSRRCLPQRLTCATCLRSLRPPTASLTSAARPCPISPCRRSTC